MSITVDSLSPQANREIELQAQLIAQSDGRWVPTAENVVLLVESVLNAERDAFWSIQREGIANAKQHGARLGRPRKTIPENFEEVYEDWKKGLVSATKAAGKLGVSPTTFTKWATARRQ